MTIESDRIINLIEESIKRSMARRTKSAYGEYVYVECPYHLALDIYRDIEYVIETTYLDGYSEGRKDEEDISYR